jgi:hypothetical protein
MTPHPIRSKENGYETPPFFIVSSGRSGTTLLRAMLLQHPAVHIPPEFKLIHNLFMQYQRVHRYLPWNLAVRLFGATIAGSTTLLRWEMALQDFYIQANELPADKQSLANLIHTFYCCHAQQVKPSATRWGEKSPANIRHLAEIDQLFPETKIIHVLRDGRDVVASIHELGWHNSLAITCEAWLQNIAAVSNYSQRHNREKFLEIRYETLVSEPEKVLSGLCDFIGLGYGPEMLNFHRHQEGLGFEARQAHHAGLARPLNADSIGSWRNRLDPAQQKYVIERLGPTLEKMGYGTV